MTRRRGLLAHLLRATPADFASAHALDTSVERLRAVTQQRWPTPRQRARRGASVAVGHVSADQVVQERAQPFARNDFRPAYRGAFRVTGGRVVLSGAFGMNSAGRAFMAAWFAVGTLIAAVALRVVAVQGLASTWWVLLAVPGVLALGAAIMAVGASAGRADQAWLAALIERALAPDTAPAANTPATPGSRL